MYIHSTEIAINYSIVPIAEIGSAGIGITPKSNCSVTQPKTDTTVHSSPADSLAQ